jgi:CheY-like chemotaxis protein
MAATALQIDQTLEYPLRKTAPAARLQEKVLLIEDSEEAMFLVRCALEDCGNGRYALSWAKSLIEGLEKLSEGGIDIVLLDLGLPESSGPESYAWVRQMAPKVPVVVLTGDPREETEFAVTASGVEGYLIKDQLSGALLLRTIQNALSSKRRRDDHLGPFRFRLTK